MQQVLVLMQQQAHQLPHPQQHMRETQKQAQQTQQQARQQTAQPQQIVQLSTAQRGTAQQERQAEALSVHVGVAVLMWGTHTDDRLGVLIH